MFVAEWQKGFFTEADSFCVYICKYCCCFDYILSASFHRSSQPSMIDVFLPLIYDKLTYQNLEDDSRRHIRGSDFFILVISCLPFTQKREETNDHVVISFMYQNVTHPLSSHKSAFRWVLLQNFNNLVLLSPSLNLALRIILLQLSKTFLVNNGKKEV